MPTIHASTTTAATRIPLGSTVRLTVPFSEVAMHLKVAGRTMRVRLVDANAAQLLDDDGLPLSFPVLPSEAGIFRDADGCYAYDAQLVPLLHRPA